MMSTRVDSVQSPTGAALPGTRPPTDTAREAKEIARLVARFRSFAGSAANAHVLALGLRYGAPIELRGCDGASVLRFTPATGDMGYGSVNIALLLAACTLTAAGIENPAPQQIRAALNGGTVRVDDAGGESLPLPGILKLRSEGRDWAAIAASIVIARGASPASNILSLELP